MVAKNLWLAVLALMVLSACQSIPIANDTSLQRPNEPQDVEPGSSTSLTTVQKSSEAAPISQQSKAPETKKSADLATQAQEALEPSAAQVVTKLQMEALQLQSEGNWSDAELKLERALRINADKVDLYHQLATVRMGQKRFAEAEQIALKGLTLTDQTPKYKASLWEVISQCRSASGDISGARKARAEMLRWLEQD